MRFYKNLIFFVIALGLLITIGIFRVNNSNPSVYQRITGFTQGTTFSITYEDVDVGDLSHDIDSVLKAFDQSLSTYLPSSLISRINRNEIDQVSDPLFIEVFQKAGEVYENTHGLFDITVGKLVDAYGFGADSAIAPSDEVIDSLLQYVGFEKITLKDGRISKQNALVTLDVNAIAQGFSVDVVADFLGKKGIENYLVEIGGEIKARGKNPNGEIWRIGLDSPVENNNIPGEDLFVKLQLKNMALATSGNYRKFYERDGVKYVHSINPKTGKPVSQNLLSATVFARDCMTADAYATACMVMGLEKSIEFLESMNQLYGYLIFSDQDGNFQVWYSDELGEYIIK